MYSQQFLDEVHPQSYPNKLVYLLLSQNKFHEKKDFWYFISVKER